jgi:hypothetical protein
LIPSLCVPSGEELAVFIMVAQSSSLNALPRVAPPTGGPRDGPKPGTLVEAAAKTAISERYLIVAAERGNARLGRMRAVISAPSHIAESSHI